MLIASFDIGEKNFAYCIADFKANDTANTDFKANDTANTDFKANDTANADIAHDTNQLNILKIKHHNVILKKTQTVIESCIRVSTLMSEDEQLMACDRFIIEQQMLCNTRAQRLAQHVWSTLYTRFPDRLIKFVPSHMKTQHFLGKNKLKDKERKTWSVIKVTKEGVMGDNERHKQIIEEIEGMKKKDDVCDTILQVIAYISQDLKRATKLKKKGRKATNGGYEQNEHEK
jgi:hypothetical protein